MSENFNAEYFSLLGISLVVISIRTVSRMSFLGIRRLQLDDYLMVLAGVGISTVLQMRSCRLTEDVRSVCTPLRPLLPTTSLLIEGSQMAA